VINKEGFNKIVKRGAGRLADKDKREEYERLMRQKKTEPPKSDDYDVRGRHNTCCGDL
jgi:hypothetical protein